MPMRRRVPSALWLAPLLAIGLGLGVPLHVASHADHTSCPFELLHGQGAPLPGPMLLAPPVSMQVASVAPATPAPTTPSLFPWQGRAPPTPGI